MIPGSISKLSEGIVPCADIIKVYNDLVRISGAGTINTINPGLGTAQGQLLMLVALDGELILGNKGNILGSIIAPRYHVVTLVFSKPLQKWLLPAAAGLDEEEEMAETVYIPFNAGDFFADSGTWTIVPGSVFGNFYYIYGKRVTMTLYIGQCSVSPDNTVRAVRMKLPAAVSNIARQGPYSSNPGGPSLFLGTAVVFPSGSGTIVGGSTACYSAVADNAHGAGEIGVPYFGVAPVVGNFPATPPGSLAIIASCTYILA